MIYSPFWGPEHHQSDDMHFLAIRVLIWSLVKPELHRWNIFCCRGKVINYFLHCVLHFFTFLHCAGCNILVCCRGKVNNFSKQTLQCFGIKCGWRKTIIPLTNFKIRFKHFQIFCQVTEDSTKTQSCVHFKCANSQIKTCLLLTFSLELDSDFWHVKNNHKSVAWVL